MNFTAATEYLKQGKKIKRAVWDDGSYVFASFCSGTVYTSSNNTYELRLYDMLATDWELHTETFDFQTALEKMKEGKQVKRPGRVTFYLNEERNEISHQSSFTFRDTQATDWYEIYD